jgi:hypothetical protein
MILWTASRWPDQFGLGKGRGVGTGGTGGGAGPPSFAKYPFSGSKVPFSCVKNVIKIAFFAQRALLKT